MQPSTDSYECQRSDEHSNGTVALIDGVDHVRINTILEKTLIINAAENEGLKGTYAAQFLVALDSMAQLESKDASIPK